MGIFKKISGEELEKILAKDKRQYLVGNLKLPQKLNHIQNSDIEIGIIDYPEEFTEKPHYHPVQKEFMYMLSGKTTYIDTETGEKHNYKKGDFFFIETNTKYGQTISPGTRILFVKYPAINDKVVLDK